MLVIGVAEPEHPVISDDQLALVQEHHMYETDTGRTLLNVGRSLGILGIWGVHGTRQRVLVSLSSQQAIFTLVILTPTSYIKSITMFISGTYGSMSASIVLLRRYASQACRHSSPCR